MHKFILKSGINKHQLIFSCFGGENLWIQVSACHAVKKRQQCFSSVGQWLFTYATMIYEGMHKLPENHQPEVLPYRIYLCRMYEDKWKY